MASKMDLCYTPHAVNVFARSSPHYAVLFPSSLVGTLGLYAVLGTVDSERQPVGI